jgi:hypothetical protein
VPLYFTVPHTSSGTPQGLLRDFSKSLQISQKVPGKVQGLLEDFSGTPQGLVKDLSEIDKDPTRTPQGLLKDFI